MTSSTQDVEGVELRLAGRAAVSRRLTGAADADTTHFWTPAAAAEAAAAGVEHQLSPSAAAAAVGAAAAALAAPRPACVPVMAPRLHPPHELLRLAPPCPQPPP